LKEGMERSEAIERLEPFELKQERQCASTKPSGKL
jgi:hypothetical protein